MSFTTDITIYVDIPDDHPAGTALVQPFPFRPDSWLTEVDRQHLQAGGYARPFAGRVFAGCFNYLDVDAVVAWFGSLPWEPQDTGSMTVAQELRPIRVVTLSDGSVTEQIIVRRA